MFSAFFFPNINENGRDKICCHIVLFHLSQIHTSSLWNCSNRTMIQIYSALIMMYSFHRLQFLSTSRSHKNKQTKNAWYGARLPFVLYFSALREQHTKKHVASVYKVQYINHWCICLKREASHKGQRCIYANIMSPYRN